MPAAFTSRTPRAVLGGRNTGREPTGRCGCSRVRRANVCLPAGTPLPLLARGDLNRAQGTTNLFCLGTEPPFVVGPP
ncbi:hypothetical protein [Streptomyces sp. NPDC055287]